ncbi:helix-turn-helix domain-containing protein [Brevibacillus choshinensis]|uniref:helix-turn-helix domain-containing protein n=1 Tax=Brevibacillus choshinensis TaxID=54911 RepID=UPI002E1D10D3|nr:helix-turn-helix domain-containing protein [Brevibacillus choshinensis]
MSVDHEENMIPMKNAADEERIITISDISMDTTQKYTMKHVTEILGISDGTIRNWERELSDFLTFERDSSGTRQFTGQDIYKLKAINQFREAGMSLSLIKTQLEIQRENRLNWDFSVAEAQSKGANTQYASISKADLEQVMGQMFLQIQSYIDARMETAAASQQLLASPEQKNELLIEVQGMIRDQFASGKEEIRTSVEEAVTIALSRVEKHRQENESKGFWRRLFG